MLPGFEGVVEDGIGDGEIGDDEGMGGGVPLLPPGGGDIGGVGGLDKGDGERGRLPGLVGGVGLDGGWLGFSGSGMRLLKVKNLKLIRLCTYNCYVCYGS